MIGLFCLFSTKLGAVSVTLSGSADICTVPAGVNVTYTAVSTSSISGGTCNIHEWEVTGGMIMETGTTRVNIFSGGDIFEPKSKCRDKACLVPGVPCLPVANAQTTSITVRWTAGASERKVKVKAKREHGTLGTYSDTAEDEGKFGTPTITRERGPATCTGATFTATLPSGTCTPTSFQWRVNGGGIITTTGNSLTVNSIDNTVSNTIEARAVFGAAFTSPFNAQSFGPSTTSPFISGPSTICAGSDNSFNIVALPGVSNINWQVSTTSVTISNPSSSFIDLTVIGSVSSFTLSCTFDWCGDRIVLMRTISVLPAGSSGCPPIPREGPIVAIGDENPDLSTPDEDEITPTLIFPQVAEENSLEPIVQYEAAEPFPNPAQAGELLSVPVAISQGTTRLQLLNLNGQVLQSLEIEGQTLYQLQLPANLPTGMYYLRQDHQLGQFTKRLMIK